MDFTLSSIDMDRIDALAAATMYRIVGKNLVPYAPDFD
jgi:2,5-diketo-D-gluconate reductase B